MIRFDHVSKRFDEGTVAVENFDLEVESHHLVVLLGSSGCGKTTLLRMVNRMVDPSGGRILIDDTDVATVDPVKLRRQIGYVMQSGGLLPHRTVVDNIATVPLLRGFPERCPVPGHGSVGEGRPGLLVGPPLPHPAVRRSAPASRSGPGPCRQP